MIPSINDIFFYFTTLFAINTFFVSEKTNVTLDFSSKSGQIEYINLKTPQKTAGSAEHELKIIKESVNFDEYFSPLNLTSKNIYTKGNKLNATLKFSFNNKTELLDLLYFHSHPSGSIRYLILENEKFVSSNGRLIKEDNHEFIEWDKKVKKIELTLTHKKLTNKDFENLVGLKRYWKNK